MLLLNQLNNHAKLALVLLSFICVLAAGMFIGARSTPKEDVSFKPQITQQDGSVIAERRIETLTERLTSKSKHEIPKGSVVERKGSVTITPDKTKDNATVDYSLTREQDGGKRMIFSTEDGEVVSAVDIPVERVVVPQERKWSAGVVYGPQNKQWGAYVQRDVGRVRLGALIVNKTIYGTLGMTF